MRVEVLLEIAGGVRFSDGKQPVVQSHFGVDCLRGADPVDRALDFAAGISPAALAVEIGRAAQFSDPARSVLHHLVALDNIGVFEARLAARTEPEVFWRRS